MTYEPLHAHMNRQRSFLCVGLDPDLTKLPTHLRREKDPILAFNRQLIEATADFCVAYKPNLAFYECLGPAGLETLARTLEFLPTSHLRIADAKRGDIGNTAAMYARAYFETMAFDAVTLSPYMGHDAVAPFLAFPDKWAILLALTSNPGSADFQQQLLKNGQGLYERVIETSQGWPHAERLMYVVGATQATYLARVRALAPKAVLLVPGIGAQGGDLATVVRAGRSADGGLLINASRSILYASDGPDFAQAARRAAQQLQQAMWHHAQT